MFLCIQHTSRFIINNIQGQIDAWRGGGGGDGKRFSVHFQVAEDKEGLLVSQLLSCNYRSSVYDLNPMLLQMPDW